MDRPLTIYDFIDFGDKKLESNLTINKRVNHFVDFVSQHPNNFTPEIILFLIEVLRSRGKRHICIRDFIRNQNRYDKVGVF